MPNNAVVSSTLALPSTPVDVTLGPIVYHLMNGTTVVATLSDSAAADATSSTVTFMAVTPGTYTVIAQRLDGSNNPVGTSVTSASFTIQLTQNVTVPTSVSVVLN